MGEIKFEQIPLFTGGYSLLTCELTWHMNGRTNTMEAAYSIRATDTGEMVEGGTLGIIGARGDTTWLLSVGSELNRRAMADLLPF